MAKRKTSLRIDASAYEETAKLAEANGLSVSSMLDHLIKLGLAVMREAEHRKPDTKKTPFRIVF